MKRLMILLLVVFAGLTQIVQAQVRGIPPSVTSLAPGRQLLPGPSVTSLGPNTIRHAPPLGGRHFDGRFIGRRGFGRFGRNAFPVFVPMYTPYAMPIYPMIYADPSSGYDPSASNDAALYQPDPNYTGQYAPQPTVSQRPLNSSSVSRPAQAATASENADTGTDADPVPQAAPDPQPATVLIFKDGHKLEVTNYIIQGTTLFNLGDSGPRRISTGDLDMTATVAENDDRGVEFKLP